MTAPTISDLQLDLSAVRDGEYDDLLAVPATGTAIAEIAQDLDVDPGLNAGIITEALAARRLVLANQAEALAGTSVLVHLRDGSTRAHSAMHLDGVDNDGSLALLSGGYPSAHALYAPGEWTRVEIFNPAAPRA